MKKTLQDRVEEFLGKAQYISFAYREEKSFSILFDRHHAGTFGNVKHFEYLMKYFEGRKHKLVIVTDEKKTTVSLVDIETGDTINIEGPKFVNGNIHSFFEAKVPVDTVFRFLILGKSEDNTTLLLPPPVMSAGKPVEIHGYSVVDKRSKQ